MSSKEFHLAIITPEGKLFEDQAVEVNLPGSEGRFGVLAGHMNLVSTIKPGVIEIRHKGSHETKLMVVYDGIAEVNGESCSILVEKGVYPKDIKTQELNSLLDAAKKELSEAHTEVAKESAQRDIEYLETIASLKSN